MENTTTNPDILVSGGGIAGSALAYWLRRAGFRPVVVERAPAPRPGGQTVDLRGAGRTVIERMGLLERARELAVDQRGIALVDRRGRHTARLPTELFGGEGIVSDLEILRGDLADLLHEAVADDVEHLFDDTLTDLRQDADGVLPPSRTPSPAASTWWSAPTACTPPPAASPSVPSASTSSRSAAAPPGSPPASTSSSTAGS